MAGLALTNVGCCTAVALALVACGQRTSPPALDNTHVPDFAVDRLGVGYAADGPE